jgi:hypothetical protein
LKIPYPFTRWSRGEEEVYTSLSAKILCSHFQ